MSRTEEELKNPEPLWHGIQGMVIDKNDKGNRILTINLDNVDWRGSVKSIFACQNRIEIEQRCDEFITINRDILTGNLFVKITKEQELG